MACLKEKGNVNKLNEEAGKHLVY